MAIAGLQGGYRGHVHAGSKVVWTTPVVPRAAHESGTEVDG